MDVAKLCGMRGCGKAAAQKQKYCSRDHAPYGNLPSDSEEMAKSIFKEPGDHFRRYRGKGKKPKKNIIKLNTTPFSGTTIDDSGKSDIGKIPLNPEKNKEKVGTPVHLKRSEEGDSSPTVERTEIQKLDAPNGETTMNEQNNTSASGSIREDLNETPPTGLSPSLTALEKAKSDSMSLIDESASQLRDLMKSVPKDNPNTVNSVCNCASQIHKLLRLKFDIVRTYVR